jgi:hypothetical protein
LYVSVQFPLVQARVQKVNKQQTKLKVQLKLSISRLRMVQQKDSAKAKQQRREMAQLIEVYMPLFKHHLYQPDPI